MAQQIIFKIDMESLVKEGKICIYTLVSTGETSRIQKNSLKPIKKEYSKVIGQESNAVPLTDQ